jgi:dTDP-glucose 4,6-dehydratase
VRELKRVLVTGGAGFVGLALCERLLAEGAQVLSIDDLSTSVPGGAATLTGRPGYRFVQHDISTPLHPSWLAGGFDTVFHLASPASPVDYLRLPIHTLRAGAFGTATALDIAERCGARLVLASTSEVYGDPAEHPQNESYWGNVNPIGVRSVYDEAKRFAEALTFAYRRARSADVGVARIFNTYGPRMRPDDGRMVPTFCRQALRGEPITVTGDGQQTRSLCFVDDTVAGLIALARSDYPGPVNIGNPAELTVLATAELIRELAGSQSPIQHVAVSPDDPQRRCPDIAVAAERLNWRPRVPYREGLAHTVSWFRAHIAAAPAAV